MNEGARQAGIFALALCLRWGLALLLFAFMGSDGFFGTDSRGFHGWVAEYVDRIHAGKVHGWDWLGPNVSLLPLPSWLWALNGLAFGGHAALTSVLCQGLLDSGTCVLVYLTAREIDPRYAAPAGIAAAVNPTQVVMANLYYTDPIFLFFLALALLGAIRWLIHPVWRAALLIGAGFGGAMLCRVVLAPWAVFVVAYLVIVLVFQRRLQGRHLTQLLGVTLIAAACTAPIIARNHANTGEWILTTQTGAHSAFWVVPLVMQARDGTAWERGAATMKQRVEARYGPDTEDILENSRRQTAVAREALAELGIWSVAKAWLYGAAINLGAPVATIFPPLAQLPRTGFFATPGDSVPGKAFNFLFRSDNAIYSWTTVLGILGVAAFRLVQLRGAIGLLGQRRHWPVALLMLSWIAFILLVSGPIASPKYRLPIEPVLMVLLAVGYCALRDRGRFR
jgi:hypothetical protein